MIKSNISLYFNDKCCVVIAVGRRSRILITFVGAVIEVVNASPLLQEAILESTEYSNP